jgi:GNAT superfamily N-acetyltransferase
MRVRDALAADREWIAGKLVELWGSTRMALRGELLDTLTCPALIAGEGEGLLQYRELGPGRGEIVTLESFVQWQGIGTALVAAYLDRARAAGLGEVRVITTNDNVDALRFYQARGFVIHKVRVNAVAAARALKPEIPPTGAYGIPIRDEIELARTLSGG